MKMEIMQKNRLAQLFCHHEYVEGVVAPAKGPVFFNLSGETVTTICKKCGKVKGKRFVKNPDGS